MKTPKKTRVSNTKTIKNAILETNFNKTSLKEFLPDVSANDIKRLINNQYQGSNT